MIPPNKKQRVELPISRLPTQTLLSLSVTVIHGRYPGPCLWLSAAIHGDEINGVEIIRQVLTQINPRHLSGTVIAVPIVNIFGFIDQSRYLPDRRDLNRSFPGSPRGSLASRLARLFMQEVVSRCKYGIDLHTASHHRCNLPQIRANLKDAETYRLAEAFGAPVMIHADSRDGSLRQAAAQRGIPVLLYEGGEALRFDGDAIAVGIQGVRRVLAALDMYALNGDITATASLTAEKLTWVRASRGGLLHMVANLGDRVEKKQPLGLITDAFGEAKLKVYAPCSGLVVGCARNPLVNQGDAIVHIAVIREPKLG